MRIRQNELSNKKVISSIKWDAFFSRMSNLRRCTLDNHTSNPIPNYSGNLVQLEIGIKAPDGTIVEVLDPLDSVQNTNLRIVQFDPEPYGYGIYTITVRLSSPCNRKVYFGLAWW
jgi:hypothetical protein